MPQAKGSRAARLLLRRPALPPAPARRVPLPPHRLQHLLPPNKLRAARQHPHAAGHGPAVRLQQGRSARRGDLNGGPCPGACAAGGCTSLAQRLQRCSHHTNTRRRLTSTPWPWSSSPGPSISSSSARIPSRSPSRSQRATQRCSSCRDGAAPAARMASSASSAPRASQPTTWRSTRRCHVRGVEGAPAPSRRRSASSKAPPSPVATQPWSRASYVWAFGTAPRAGYCSAVSKARLRRRQD